jgi:hypothetical protein
MSLVYEIIGIVSSVQYIREVLEKSEPKMERLMHMFWSILVILYRIRPHCNSLSIAIR